MMTLEVKNTQGKSLHVETFNTQYEAKNQAIRMCGYAGFLKFVKERGGDITASNSKYKVDIMY